LYAATACSGIAALLAYQEGGDGIALDAIVADARTSTPSAAALSVATLTEFLQTETILFMMDATAASRTPTFTTVDDLRTEVENARLYGGDHWRKGGSDGTKIGDHVAKWALKRYFQPR
jgi:hypothetical protein